MDSGRRGLWWHHHTWIQWRLHRGQLLPSHRRPSYWTSSSAVVHLHLRSEPTRTLLHRQPPAGKQANYNRTNNIWAFNWLATPPGESGQHRGSRMRGWIPHIPLCFLFALEPGSVLMWTQVQLRGQLWISIWMCVCVCVCVCLSSGENIWINMCLLLRAS